MKQIFYALFFFPILTYAQIENNEIDTTKAEGIRFERGLNWQEIERRAKEEGKFIFVDCFATWCGPCKRMARVVFRKRQVGEFMNAHFISVQVQMDTSAGDNYYVKRWYEEAHRMQHQYGIKVLPTFLFFSPEGKIVHRYLSAIDENSFIRVAGNALNPDTQYYSLLSEYEKGEMDFSKMNYLASFAQWLGDDSVAKLIATDYLHNFLDGLPRNDLYHKQYWEFISTFSSILSSNDGAFKLVYTKSDKVDKMMNRKDFSKNLVSYIITKEEVNPILWRSPMATAADPGWKRLFVKIRRKYGKYYASLVILNSQLRWYTQKKDWGKMIMYTVAKMERYGLDTTGIGWAVINNIAFDLFFQHCNNRDTLTKMIGWMEIVNRTHPDDHINMDTYANLLYKVGRRSEAIYWEEKAAKLEYEAALREKRKASLIYRETVESMKNGIPTWVQNE